MADINTILQALVPKDKRFYPLFEKSANSLCDMSSAMHEGLKGSDVERINMLDTIRAFEKQGDAITDAIVREANAIFLVPFDREDIHYLTTAMDDVVDYIYASVKKIHFHEVNPNDEGIRKLADVICEGAKEVSQVIMQLRELKRPEKIMEAIVRINSLENHADKIFDSCIKELFDNENDFKNLIRRREVYTVMEVATDKFEDVANVIETIIVKYA
jgi:uncharacterized protein Yka (UPF0111/DUF47 family)